MKREKCLFRVHFQDAVIRTCSLRRLKKKNLGLQPIKRRARFSTLEAKLVALSPCFEALAHKFDARSRARPTLSQNSDLQEDFLPAENVDVFDPEESGISGWCK